MLFQFKFKHTPRFALFFPQAKKAVKKYGSNYGTASKYMLYNGPYVQKGWTGSRTSTISTAYLIRPEIKNVYNDNLGGWQFKYASVK